MFLYFKIVLGGYTTNTFIANKSKHNTFSQSKEKLGDIEETHLVLSSLLLICCLQAVLLRATTRGHWCSPRERHGFLLPPPPPPFPFTLHPPPICLVIVHNYRVVIGPCWVEISHTHTHTHTHTGSLTLSAFARSWPQCHGRRPIRSHPAGVVWEPRWIWPMM